jgi:hypothetical protein
MWNPFVSLGRAYGQTLFIDIWSFLNALFSVGVPVCAF